MRKTQYLPYILLVFFVACLFSFPKSTVEKLRSRAVPFAKGFWKMGMRMQTLFFPPACLEKGEKSIEDLQMELLLLKTQNEELLRLLASSHEWIDQVKKIEGLETLKEKTNAPFYQRRIKAAETLLELKRFSIPAEVIYRNPTEWNSTLWVDVGTNQNALLDKEVVAIGSPVLKGPHLIGVVEFVGLHKSRIRLLTDGALVPSVRVARGGEDRRELRALIQEVLRRLAFKENDEETARALERLLEHLKEEKVERFLAKGELMGSGGSLWKKRSEILKGVGFNYDFEDEEGPPLELESGKPLDQLREQTSTPLIEVGDLLVTTGMDGVFPKDLPVAHVVTVSPLKEGSPSFDIEARLAAGPLNDLLHVTILPPLVKTSPFEAAALSGKDVH